MFRDIRIALAAGKLIPYLGARAIKAAGGSCSVPDSPEALAARMIASVSVPHKLRGNMTGTAQFIENFKHRKTLVSLMKAAYTSESVPPDLHRFLAAQPSLPLLVHAWYDDLPQRALSGRNDWGVVQGLSQSEHFGKWTGYYGPDGQHADDPSSRQAWRTLLYEPLGGITPAANFLVSDSDFVEVLTEIDIQTPIPDEVKQIRSGRNFLFLGCRFSTQLERIFAHQIMKRSSDRHWAVLPEEPTRNEIRFMANEGIERLAIGVDELLNELTAPLMAA